MTAPDADTVLDCTGLTCPLPVLKTAKAIKELEVGQILRIIATDPGAPPDIEAWARQTGHELLESVRQDDRFVFLVRRGR